MPEETPPTRKFKLTMVVRDCNQQFHKDLAPGVLSFLTIKLVPKPGVTEISDTAVAKALIEAEQDLILQTLQIKYEELPE